MTCQVRLFTDRTFLGYPVCGLPVVTTDPPLCAKHAADRERLLSP